MKKIVCIIPLIAGILLTGCNNGPKEYLECYSKVTFRNKGQLKYYELCEYNEMHLISKKTRYEYSNDNVTKIGDQIDFTFEYNDSKLLTKQTKDTYIYEDEEGSSKKHFESVTENWTYDEQGNVVLDATSNIRYKDAGNETFDSKKETVYTYDDNKNILNSITSYKTKINDQPEEETTKISYEATYDNKNRITSKKEKLYDFGISDYITQNESAFTYDSYETYKTKTTKEYSYSGEFKQGEKYEVTFDSEGLILNEKIIDIDSNGNELHPGTFALTEFTYDSNKNIRRKNTLIHTPSNQGELETLGQECEYTYFNGNPNKPEISIESGYTKFFGGVTSIKKYSYDEYGRIIFYDFSEINSEARNPQKHEVYTYEYNELIEKQ